MYYDNGTRTTVVADVQSGNAVTTFRMQKKVLKARYRR